MKEVERSKTIALKRQEGLDLVHKLRELLWMRAQSPSPAGGKAGFMSTNVGRRKVAFLSCRELFSSDCSSLLGK